MLDYCIQAQKLAVEVSLVEMSSSNHYYTGVAGHYMESDTAVAADSLAPQSHQNYCLKETEVSFAQHVMDRVHCEEEEEEGVGREVVVEGQDEMMVAH